MQLNKLVQYNKGTSEKILLAKTAVGLVIFFVSSQIVKVIIILIALFILQTGNVLANIRGSVYFNFTYLYISHFIGYILTIMYLKTQTNINVVCVCVKLNLKKVIVLSISFFSAVIVGGALTNALTNVFNYTQQQQMTQLQTGFEIYATFIYICIIIPVVEEILFRAIFVNMFRHAGVTFCCVFVSIIFTLLHQNIIQMPAIFLLSIILCYVYYTTKSLLLCVIFHLVNNVFAFFELFFKVQENSFINNVLIILSTITFMCILIRKYINKSKKEQNERTYIQIIVPKLVQYIFSPTGAVLAVIIVLNAIGGIAK